LILIHPNHPISIYFFNFFKELTGDSRAKLGKTFELPSTVRKPAASQVAHRHAKRFGPRTWFDADESHGGKQTMQTQTNP